MKKGRYFVMRGVCGTQQLSALIIAEEENARLYRALQLKGERIEVCAIEDSMDHIKQCKPDVVLLDCGYRVWTGISTLRQIKEAYPDMPVIFLTDPSSGDAAINAFKLGAREYFRKPVNIFELKRTLDRLLSDKQRASVGCRGPFIFRNREEGAPCAGTVTTDKQKNLLQVIAFIEENLWSSLELGSLAEKAHLSKFHFCRVFKRHIGMNPMKFVTSLRIERAKELLKRNDVTVSLVANEVGFKDLSNFIRQFKKITGVRIQYVQHGHHHDEIAVCAVFRGGSNPSPFFLGLIERGEPILPIWMTALGGTSAQGGISRSVLCSFCMSNISGPPMPAENRQTSVCRCGMEGRYSLYAQKALIRQESPGDIRGF